MSKDSEGFSLKFALKMVQMADQPDLIWLKHEVEPYPDDNPVNPDGTLGNFRHLSIRVQRQDFLDITAECFMFKTSRGWSHGSVRIGNCDESGEVCSYEPEQFFQYSDEGMTETRRVPIELSNADNIIRAQILDNPDARPSQRGEEDSPLPFAFGSTIIEALGALLKDNQELFRVVIRYAPGFVAEKFAPVKVIDFPSQKGLAGNEGMMVTLTLKNGAPVNGVIKHVGPHKVFTETTLDGITVPHATNISDIKQAVLTY
ncbi:MAG: hypothetical protein HY918_01930 [Candidatus Doudnabacteria bacterium]|nr:hypothetical protein [Candidatus Doudnabacteria bacterium]